MAYDEHRVIASRLDGWLWRMSCRNHQHLIDNRHVRQNSAPMTDLKVSQILVKGRRHTHPCACIQYFSTLVEPLDRLSPRYLRHSLCTRMDHLDAEVFQTAKVLALDA